MATHYLRQFFAYDHLPAHLQPTSRPFAELAALMDENLPENAEKSTCLRKVRALLFKPASLAEGA